MNPRNRRVWDGEALASAAVLAAAIVILVIGAFEVRDQNARQADQAACASCAVQA